MNLVISTTFGWNIGDQFILSSVKNLIQRAWGRFQCVHHDRNPFKLLSGGSESHNAISCGWADALVIAGSPGWTLECAQIYRTALDNKTPIYMIGIGTGVDYNYLSKEVSGNSDIIEAIQMAKLIICRDEIARDVIKGYRDAELLPCPVSTISHPESYVVSGRHLVAMGPHLEQGNINGGLVAHQVSDLENSEGRAFYSEIVEDYFSLYVGAYSVLSSRLHASILCRAFDVPVANLWPESDPRCSSTWSVVDESFKSGIYKSVDKYFELLYTFRPEDK